MQKRLVDLTKSDSLNDSDYLFINHDDNPIQVSLPYFKQNVAPVDATLTEERKAADAKATGDKINEINKNIESINTEIEGVKTNYATKEELSEVSTNLTETQEDVSELSTSIENVKADYLTKSDAQNVYLTKEDASTISDKEFYEGRKYDGETYSGIASNKGIKLHKVVGKTEQDGEPSSDNESPIQNVNITKINSGTNQLFDASKIPTTSIGGATVTNNGDGSFTISGSGALTGLFGISTFLGYNPLKAKRLIVRMNGSDGNDPYPAFQVIGCSVVGNSSVENRTFTITNNGYFDITEDILNKTKDIHFIFYGGKGDEIKPGTIKPMVYQDGDGTWEPFKHATVETSLTLAEGDVYEDGVVTRKRKKVVFDGSSDESWGLQSINEYGIANFVLYVQDIKSSSLGKSNRFKLQTSSISVTQEEGFSLAPGTIYIRINKETASTVENFRTWLSTHNLVVEYELDTPTTEEFKVPTIPSYYPFTNVSTDNDLTTDITWKILADCDNSLKQEELEKRILALETKAIE